MYSCNVTKIFPVHLKSNWFQVDDPPTHHYACTAALSNRWRAPSPSSAHWRNCCSNDGRDRQPPAGRHRRRWRWPPAAVQQTTGSTSGGRVYPQCSCRSNGTWLAMAMMWWWLQSSNELRHLVMLVVVVVDVTYAQTHTYTRSSWNDRRNNYGLEMRAMRWTSQPPHTHKPRDTSSAIINPT